LGGVGGSALGGIQEEPIRFELGGDIFAVTLGETRALGGVGASTKSAVRLLGLKLAIDDHADAAVWCSR
jgi:hypothetical protein